MSNHVPVTLTLSLNVMEMFASAATPVAPFVGFVLETVGGPSTTSNVHALFDDDHVESPANAAR
jgi:hypothetical protein